MFIDIPRSSWLKYIQSYIFDLFFNVHVYPVFRFYFVTILFSLSLGRDVIHCKEARLENIKTKILLFYHQTSLIDFAKPIRYVNSFKHYLHLFVLLSYLRLFICFKSTSFTLPYVHTATQGKNVSIHVHASSYIFSIFLCLTVCCF